MCFICLYSAARQLLARWWRRTGSLRGAAALLSTCEPLPCMPISSYGFCMYCSISSQEGPFARCIEVAGWIALENCVLRCKLLQVVRERCDGHPLHCGLQRLQGRGQQPHQAGQHTPFSSSLPTTLLHIASLSAHCFACASCAVFETVPFQSIGICRQSYSGLKNERMWCASLQVHGTGAGPAQDQGECCRPWQHHD